MSEYTRRELLEEHQNQRKARELEDTLDILLEDGEAYPEDLEDECGSYEELEPYDKVQVLTEIYRRASREPYDASEMVQRLEEIEEGQPPEEPGEELKTETVHQHRTGRYPDEPEKELVGTRMETGDEDEWIRCTQVLDAEPRQAKPLEQD